jgi:hypothetical protein
MKSSTMNRFFNQKHFDSNKKGLDLGCESPKKDTGSEKPIKGCEIACKELKESKCDIVPNESIDILKFIQKQDKKNQLKFSYSNIITMYWCNCCAGKKLIDRMELYYKATKILDEYLDIGNIIHRFEELEKLKLLCLSYEQLAVFNFIAKDFCTLDEFKHGESTINKYKDFNKDKDKLASTISKFKKRIQDDEDLTEIDRKIYDLLREDLKY